MNETYVLGICTFCKLECSKTDYYHSECEIKAWNENAEARKVKKEERKLKKEALRKNYESIIS